MSATTEQRTCAVPKCPEQIPPNMAMCTKHWCFVPASVRARMLRHYTTGQDKHGVSPGYRLALEAAVKAVILAELGAATRPQYPPGSAAPPASSLPQPDGQ